VKAKIVVSAAGALHTPALLLRSQLSHRGMVGANLTLHPVLGVGGVFPGQEVSHACAS
jgi:long-chain-alcohol oxidase